MARFDRAHVLTVRVTAAALLMFLMGCQAGGVYDPQSLAAARNLVVLPGVGAPGVDGPGAGWMQSGLLITALTDLDYYHVEGPARLRKAFHSAGGKEDGLLDPKLQAGLTKELETSLLVLTDVLDYRFTKETHNQDWFFGTSVWTETTYWVATAIRFVRPEDGVLVFAGRGEATSKEGYGPAVLAANQNALQELKQFVVQEKEKQRRLQQQQRQEQSRAPATAPAGGKEGR